MIFYVVKLLDVPSWKHRRNLESLRVLSPGFDNDSKMMVINRRSTASDLSRQLSSATGTTVSKQTVYRRLGHIGLYARRPVRWVPITATHCRLRLTWSRGHALGTPQQWSCVMFSDESRFSLQSDSCRTLIWRAPGTRYHQENTTERHRYGGAGWLVWGGIILGSRTDLHVQSVTMTGQIYRDVIFEQHVCLFRGTMFAEFLFMDDNDHPHRASIVDECLQSEDITRMDWPAYSPDLNLIEHVWDMLGRRIAARQPPPTCVPELRRALLDEWCNIPQDQMDNLILSMPRRLSARTIQRRLLQSGLSARRPLLGLPLTQNHRRLRGKWCDERRMWVEQWNEVVFTNESRVCLQHHDGRIRVWRHSGERMLNSCVMQRHTGPAPGIMVWGGIEYHSGTPLVRIAGTLNSQRYIIEVLEPAVLPYLQGLSTAIFQQDNA
ncbi:transposable element Tcb1 transposase [Trichonephila clavipes]|uniref:Transposable element Tcb1 transposase n=1 Tax=Trichonephila clavipes TaxID=2585209 RepID=A0A8X6T1E2_TRICX|nr:transposable element Tcb1 transposase [Trichonephila clavipes]